MNTYLVYTHIWTNETFYTSLIYKNGMPALFDQTLPDFADLLLYMKCVALVYNWVYIKLYGVSVRLIVIKPYLPVYSYLSN